MSLKVMYSQMGYYSVYSKVYSLEYLLEFQSEYLKVTRPVLQLLKRLEFELESQ